MIGTSAFLIGLAFVLFPLVAGFVAFRDWRSRGSRGSLAVCALLVPFLLLVGNRFVNNARYLYELRSMSAAEVSGVEVGGKAVTDPRAVSEIVASLNDVTWFSYNHGGTAKPVEVFVNFKSGSRGRYVVSYYTREEGAVVEFGGRLGGMSVSYGGAFGRRIPKAFEAAGLPLPRK